MKTLSLLFVLAFAACGTEAVSTTNTDDASSRTKLVAADDAMDEDTAPTQPVLYSLESVCITGDTLYAEIHNFYDRDIRAEVKLNGATIIGLFVVAKSSAHIEWHITSPADSYTVDVSSPNFIVDSPVTWTGTPQPSCD